MHLIDKEEREREETEAVYRAHCSIYRNQKSTGIDKTPRMQQWLRMVRDAHAGR